MQCVEHVIEFKMNKDKNGGDANADHQKINARDFFVPTQVITRCFYSWDQMDIKMLIKLILV